MLFQRTADFAFCINCRAGLVQFVQVTPETRAVMGTGRLVTGLLGGAVTTLIGMALCVGNLLDEGPVSFWVIAVLMLLSGFTGMALTPIARSRRMASVGLVCVGVLTVVLVILWGRSMTPSMPGDSQVRASFKFLWPPILMMISGALGIWGSKGLHSEEAAGPPEFLDRDE